jgi:N6-L-threonylcarbamoyladenine synthase
LEHDATGGVVPEVAARSHANAIFPCIYDALSDAGITLDQIDIIACTRSPGLAPSLLTGIVVAETLALSLTKPLIWIDHIEAHMFANFLERDTLDIQFPNLTLTVSGGHTEIYLWKSLYEFELIAQTRDDAAGECFDKVAKMMGRSPDSRQSSRTRLHPNKNSLPSISFHVGSLEIDLIFLSQG